MNENAIYLNCLVKWVGTSMCERLLCWHVVGESYYFIAVESGTAWPFVRSKVEFDDSLKKGAVIVLAQDHLVLSLRMDDALSPAQKKCQEQAWLLIKDLVADKQNLVMDRRHCVRLIKESAKQHGVHEGSVKKHLRRFWQRGQTSMAVQPDYFKCGTAIKPRQIGVLKLGTVNADGTHVGINVTPQVKEHFKSSLDRYYLTEKRLPFRMVYLKMLKDCYTVGYEVLNGATAPVLAPIDQLPTFAQFRYFYDKNYRKMHVLRKRIGTRRFEQNFREVTRDQTKTAQEIGDIYQIDATTADVYLVLSGNKDIVVGRPVVYLLIDVFSTLVTGLHVTFSNMCYDAASMAIWNAYSDKVAFCEEAGVKGISPAHWPARGLPNSIFADRGEMLGSKTDQIAQKLNIKLDIAPAYCPTAKAIVERHFGLLTSGLIKWLPGAVPESNADKDGKADYRKKASMTQEEFTEALIRAILRYNVCVRPDYKPTPEMISDAVELSPCKIWEWDVKVNGKRLRDINPQMVRLSLLPAEEGRVTEHGITFKGLNYTCKRARLEEWFSSVRAKSGRWKVKCSYDPYGVDRIFLVGKNIQDSDECELTGACATFTGWSWAACEAYQKCRRLLGLAEQKGDLGLQVATQAQIDVITDEAEKRRKANGPANVQYISEAKLFQLETEQKKRSEDMARLIGSKPKTVTESVTPVASNKVTDAWAEACEDETLMETK